MAIFFPAQTLPLVDVFAPCFTAPSFAYFQSSVWALLVVEGRTCLTRLARCVFFQQRDLRSWERFLAAHRWSLTAVTERLITLVVAQLGERLQVPGASLVGQDTTLVANCPPATGGPSPGRRTLQTLDRLACAEVTGFDLTEHGIYRIELHLRDVDGTEERGGEGPQLLGSFHHPLQHGVRIDLRDPRGGPNPQAFGQAGQHMHEALDRRPFAMNNGAVRFQKNPLQPRHCNWRHGPPLGWPLARRVSLPSHPR